MSDPSVDLRIKDPFGPASAPVAYVPFAAAERALREVDQALGAGRVAMLIGPPGLGKTLLLHRVAVRQENLQALYVPFCSLSLSEMCSLALRLFEWDVDTDAVISVAQHARALHESGSGLLLLIDDVGAMPEETATGLAALLDLSGGSLRIVMAADGTEQAAHVSAAFGPHLTCVALEEGMSAEETRQYVTTRLDLVSADGALRAAFDSETIDALHRSSEGNPRRVNAAAQAIVRRTEGAVLPKLSAAQTAGTEPVRTTGSTLSAMLAHESDVREVVEALRSGGQAAGASEPRAPIPPQPLAPPSVDPGPGPPAPAAAERGAQTTERKGGATESAVGTYRMSRSGITERPHVRDRASADAPDLTTAAAFKRQQPAAAPPSAASQPPSEVVREAAVLPQNTTRRMTRRVLVAIGAASIAAGFLWATLDPSAWKFPDAWSEKLSAVVQRATSVFEGLLVVTEVPPIAVTPFEPEAEPTAIAPIAEMAPAASAVRAGKPKAEPATGAVAPESAAAPVTSDAEDPGALSRAIALEPDEPDTIADSATSSAPVAVKPESEEGREATPRADIAVAPEPDANAATTVIVVEGVTAAEEIRDAGAPEPAIEAATESTTGAATEPTAESGVVEPAAVVTDEAPVEPGSEAPPTTALEAAPSKPEIIRIAINAIPWAVIEVDGLELGETPLAGVGLPAGEHTFRARMPDGSVREQTITIDAENRRVVFE